MSLSFVEIIGYVSSVIVAVSLVMSSIEKLRWYNLVGASLMTVYAFVIQSWPVFLVNLFISIVDVYYLIRIYFEKEYFKILEVGKDSRYADYFIDFYENDIKTFFPNFEHKIKEKDIVFTILRNVITAGVFIGEKKDNGTLLIKLDYVTPEYRGYKPGNFLFNQSQEYFYQLGFRRFLIYVESEKHLKYTLKMGFTQTKDKDGKECYEKSIESIVI